MKEKKNRIVDKSVGGVDVVYEVLRNSIMMIVLVGTSVETTMGLISHHHKLATISSFRNVID